MSPFTPARERLMHGLGVFGLALSALSLCLYAPVSHAADQASTSTNSSSAEVSSALKAGSCSDAVVGASSPM